MRNGAEVEIIGRRRLIYKDMDGRRQELFLWAGRVLGTQDGRCCWQQDGYYAPECGGRPHELDIVGIARGKP